MLVYTLGFLDRDTLLFKFDKHVTRRQEFAYADADEYETHADSFNGGPRDLFQTEQCHRKKRDGTEGDQIRYNARSQEFGVLGTDNVIRGYYVPNPTRHLRGDNATYYQEACHEVRG